MRVSCEAFPRDPISGVRLPSRFRLIDGPLLDFLIGVSQSRGIRAGGIVRHNLIRLNSSFQHDAVVTACVTSREMPISRARILCAADQRNNPPPSSPPFR